MDLMLTITGVPRSGTTLVYQVCKQIVADGKSELYKHKTNGVVRRHTFVKPGVAFDKNVILCLRDPRDALASYMKLRNVDNKPLSVDDWFKFLKDTMRMYEDSTKEGYHIFRYEFFHPHNLMEMYKTLCEIMVCEVDEEYGNWLFYDRFSIARAKSAAEKLPHFDKYDKDMIHGMHITNDGKIGGWVGCLGQDVLDRLSPYVKELGYE